MVMEGPNYLTIEQVAKRLQCSERTVRRWIADARLVAHRLPGGGYRILESDLELLLSPNEVIEAPEDNSGFLADGSVTSPQGFLAGAAYAGIKTYSQDKMDLGILLSTHACTSAGTYTTNKFVSPSVTLTKQIVESGSLRGLFVTSGIANAGVGEQGMIDAIESITLAAEHAGVPADALGIGTTGVIGVELPMALIRSGIPNIEMSPDGGNAFARAIMTTDRVPKSSAIKFDLGGTTVTIGGCAKGSGMIHPNMATMLAYITTDAAIEESFLRTTLSEVVDDTFNMVTIDGDTSTNDMVVVMANGAARNNPISANTPEATLFMNALRTLANFLARELVRDAEGSNKIFSVRVDEAQSLSDARAAAKAIAASSLVKTAIHGNDPNWGRVIAAAGYSGAELDVSKVSFFINDVAIMESGFPIAFHRDAVIAIMNNSEVTLSVKLGLGKWSATAWGCELTASYVQFNSAYTT